MPLVATAAVAGAAAVLTGQAFYSTRRRDLPSVVGLDASGVEGDDTLPVVRVGCVGDSTLTGPGLDDPADVWIRQAARLAATERHVLVQSLAVGGSVVRDVIGAQLQPLLDFAPDIAVVAVGSNDALRGTPLREVEASFNILLRALTAAVPTVIVGGVGDLGVIARVPRPLSSVVSARGRQVNRVIRRTVLAHPPAVYIDVSTADGAFRAGGRAVFTSDLFHPNRHGHAIWAGVAGPVLAHAIRQVPVSPR
jgi:lysophospholipase L1-like esterase